MTGRHRKARMPDPRAPLRLALVASGRLVVCVLWLAVLAIVAWLGRPETAAERLGRIEARVAEMDGRPR